MEEFGVMTRTEMFSRYEVEMEHYAKIINIEALTMLEMARRQLLPAVSAYMSPAPSPPRRRSARP